MKFILSKNFGPRLGSGFTRRALRYDECMLSNYRNSSTYYKSWLHTRNVESTVSSRRVILGDLGSRVPSPPAGRMIIVLRTIWFTLLKRTVCYLYVENISKTHIGHPFIIYDACRQVIQPSAIMIHKTSFHVYYNIILYIILEVNKIFLFVSWTFFCTIGRID